MGYKKNEITDLTIFDIIHPDEIEHCQKLFMKVMSGEDIGLVTTTFMTRTGQNIFVDGNVNCHFLNGKPTYTRAIFRDITERMRAEGALQESEQNFRNSMDNSPLGIIILGDRGAPPNDEREEMLYANNTIMDIYGFSSLEEMQTASLDNRYTSQTIDEITKRIKQRELGKAIPTSYEVEIIRKDGGNRHLHVSTEAVLWDGKLRIQLVSQDITARKKAEKKVEQLYKQEKELRQSLENEMKRRAEFANILVHELKTPLVPIIAASELLAEEVHEEQLLKIITSIQRGASTLNSRIDTMLDVARGELGTLELEYEEIDPLVLFNQVAEEMSSMASSQGLSFVLEVPSALPLVWTDKGRLEQVIMNILTNAFKWTPREGTITLRAKEKDAALMVEVQDTGEGIAKENWKKIFEAYYRVESGEKRPAGLGLGLALCKTIIKAHRGKIWVESKVGKGSTFSFSIPLSRS
ncbi:ATP-binding protein [Chloroflexota bacterium]